MPTLCGITNSNVAPTEAGKHFMSKSVLICLIFQVKVCSLSSFARFMISRQNFSHVTFIFVVFTIYNSKPINRMNPSTFMSTSCVSQLWPFPRTWFKNIGNEEDFVRPTSTTKKSCVLILPEWYDLFFLSWPIVILLPKLFY